MSKTMRLGGLVMVGVCILGAVACAAPTDPDPTPEATIDSHDSLSVGGNGPSTVPTAAPVGPQPSAPVPPELGGDYHEFVGAWQSATGTAIVFEDVVDGAGHHFFAHALGLSTAAAAKRAEGAFTVSKDFLHLDTKSSGSRSYRYNFSGKDAVSLSDGMSVQTFKRIESYCDVAADCDGQSIPHVTCVGNFVCTPKHACNWICGKPASTN